jgi:hypothetical protein
MDQESLKQDYFVSHSNFKGRREKKRMTLFQGVLKKWLLIFVLCFSTFFTFFPQSKADAATTGLPWNFSYAFDSNLTGATKFYYNANNGRLKIYMNSRTPYDYYSGSFKVTLMRDAPGPDYAVSHAGYPLNDDKTVIFTYQYNGKKLPSGYYYLKFSNSSPWPYTTGKGTASYTR